MNLDAARQRIESAITQYVTELLDSFRAGLGLNEEDDIVVEFRKDTPKGGD